MLSGSNKCVSGVKCVWIKYILLSWTEGISVFSCSMRPKELIWPSLAERCVGCEIIRECIFTVQSAARSSLGARPVSGVGGSIEFEWGVYLSAPFSSEQRLPQQLRREDAANTESYRRAKGVGGEAKRSKLRLRFFFFFFSPSPPTQRHRAFSAEQVTGSLKVLFF